ncbi:O-acetylhomoserine aminocarboxypropyltransferase/cysteine synthase family protein [Bifidobacterium favimelis]|uniref:Aminotransferase class I/II-fold pyridoxal phosphate-dependent enzyme n=1 Tax=Bifidobacterium favimelis TaxID=3122979 RepID=A0ABU8ZMJ8_9BIFI
MGEGFGTRAVHDGYDCRENGYAASVPIYQTSAFDMVDADRGDGLAAGTLDGFSYSRLANPTVKVLEDRLASLEHGRGAVAVASGMAAVSFALMCAAEKGGRLISSSSLYGTSVDAMETFFPNFGIHTDFVDDINDLDAVEALIDDRTRAIFAESVANPSTAVTDIPGLARLAHRHGVALIIDNTVPTPYLLNPIDFGADIVVHSTTKGINGHGNAMGGVIVDGGRFDWGNGRYPQMTQPELVISDERHGSMVSFLDAFGDLAFLHRVHTKYLHTFGAVMSPFNAYLQLNGLETLAQRVPVQVATARRLADHLSTLPQVTQVNYSGLLAGQVPAGRGTGNEQGGEGGGVPAPDDRQAHLVNTLLPKGVGPILSFRVEGGYERVKRIVDGVRLISYMPNIGDCRTLIVDPARITHREVPAVYRRAAGVDDDLLRISAGLEEADDLIADLDQAIAAAYA